MAKSAKRGGFVYQRRSPEAVRERAASKGGNFDSIIKSKYKVYKVKDGKNLLRILPATWGTDDVPAEHYAFELHVNYGIGVDNQSYLSLSKMLGKKDPLAEARRAADKEGDEEVAKALAPRSRMAMWVIDREAEDEGPQIWLCPYSVDKDIMQLCIDDDNGGVLMIDDPKKGNDIRFHKEGKGLMTKYPAAKMRVLKPSPISMDADQQQDWLDYIGDNPIPDCLQYYDYDHINESYGGNVRSDKDDEDKKPKRASRPADEDEDEEDSPPPRRSKSRRAADEDEDEDEVPWKGRGKKPADDDEEDEPAPRKARRVEPEDDDDGDEDDAPPPRRTRTPLKARDEDEDEDEAEEEPAPRKRARAAPVDEDDDDNTADPGPKKGGLRERIASRRSAGAGKSRAADDDE